MSISDNREGAPGGQARKPRRATKSESEPLFKSAKIDRDTMYSTGEAAVLAGTTEDTIGKWKNKGLEYVPKEKLGTKQDRILGLWLLRFMNRQKVVNTANG